LTITKPVFKFLQSKLHRLFYVLWIEGNIVYGFAYMNKLGNRSITVACLLLCVVFSMSAADSLKWTSPWSLFCYSSGIGCFVYGLDRGSTQPSHSFWEIAL